MAEIAPGEHVEVDVGSWEHQHRCEEHVGLAAGNHVRLLPQCFSHPRQALLALLENLPLHPTSQDRSVAAAVAFILANQNSRSVKLSVAGDEQKKPLDLGFVSDAWWPLVTGLRTNRFLRFEDGEPILAPVDRYPTPKVWIMLCHRSRNIWNRSRFSTLSLTPNTGSIGTRHFGPISGLESKLKRARERYLLTVFCYGCNLGPVQTARSARGVNRFQLAFINQRHITEQFLNDAITTIVNAYVRFPLQSLWGDGKSASADGTKWNLYPQDLMSEYHIRYGGYGGIGYYLETASYCLRATEKTRLLLHDFDSQAFTSSLSN